MVVISVNSPVITKSNVYLQRKVSTRIKMMKSKNVEKTVPNVKTPLNVENVKKELSKLRMETKSLAKNLLPLDANNKSTSNN